MFLGALALYVWLEQAFFPNKLSDTFWSLDRCSQWVGGSPCSDTLDCTCMNCQNFHPGLLYKISVEKISQVIWFQYVF